MRGGSGWTYGVGARSQILIDGMSTLNPKTGEINWNTIPLENVEPVSYTHLHSRRIGNFDVSGSMNLFTDEGYRQQGYNKRFRMGGNLTYHQPDMGMKLLNYGFNIDFLSNQYGDVFIWRSPT